MRIYVASSWKNNHQPSVVQALREDSHVVYDFKDSEGFHWSEVDPLYGERNWTPVDWRENLRHPAAERGFIRDMVALENCAACIMVTPCGQSASLELGYCIGAKKKTAIYIPDDSQQPELMFKMADEVFTDLSSMREWLLEIPTGVAFR